MPRYRRDYAPGAVQHIIVRFVNRAFRLDTPGARAAYLARLAISCARTDWALLGYALMSSHVHLVGIAGHDPLDRLLRSVHTGMAGWLNRRSQSLGPVFAERPRTVTAATLHTARLLAYVHNNPVRAGLVESAAKCRWTSHRAYLGMTSAPGWLDVRQGLALSGFDPSRNGRRAFAEVVAARSRDPRDPAISGDDAGARAAVREALGAPIELAAPVWPAELPLPQLRRVIALDGTPYRPRPPGDLQALLAVVAARRGVSVDRMRSRDRAARTVAARRVFLQAAIDALGWPTNASAATIGLTTQGASQLLRRAGEHFCTALRNDAHQVAAEFSLRAGHSRLSSTPATRLGLRGGPTARRNDRTFAPAQSLESPDES